MRPKLVALIAAAALTTGWVLASIVSPPVARLQGLPDRDDRRTPPRQPREDAPFTEQLQLKLQSTPIAPVPRRNPFVFGHAQRREEARETAGATQSAVPAIDAPAVPVVTGPALRLSGIGSTATPDGPIHTAIISDGTTVHLVKVGETLNGYAVIAITDETVTLENAAGAQWTLRLQ